jgi:prevent-host-death family protein
MSAIAIDIAALPHRDATEVKNKWGSVVRQVKALGRVAITNRKEPELVVMSAEEYGRLMTRLEEAMAYRERALQSLSARFDESLAQLQDPDAHKRLDTLFETPSDAETGVIAGKSF